ncbi:MAG: glycosyltransferase family 2 protein [Pseudomonadota bacterium]
MTKLSLALPVFNGENYLRYCLESVLSQTYADFELLISDNASTDGTPDICREFAARDSRIKLIVHEENIGAAGNFNFVFHQTNAPFFKWIAHDDLLEPTYLEKTMAHLEANPDACLAHSHTRVFTKDPSEGEEFVPSFTAGADDPVGRLWDMLLYGQRCYEVFGIIRRSALEKTDLIGNHKGGDNVLLYRLSLIGVFEVVPETLFLLRRHEKQSTSMEKDSQAFQQWFTGRTARISFPDWRFMRAVWKIPLGISLPLATQFRCYLAVIYETWARRRRLIQNLRVAAEILIFGNSNPTQRKRLFRSGPSR